ncbi:DUF2141 domain-containing protein [Novosphingobium resinovorum]
MLAGATAPQNTDVSVSVTDMRSAKGQVLACLTTRPDAFPDCEKDPQARKLTVPAASDLHLDFGAVPQGRYAVSLIHDENGNGKLDTRLMIPREGYGFSRDAPVRMGPPKFAQAAFDVAGNLSAWRSGCDICSDRLAPATAAPYA